MDLRAPEEVASAKNQLVGDLAHLRKLRSSLQRTSIVIARSAMTYVESRKLLERIDGTR
jgi:hypothetical protein